MSTHNGADSPFATLIEDTRAGRYSHSIHRTTLDDALADGLYRRICQVTGRPWTQEAETAWRADLIRRYRPNEDEELFAIPAMGGGTYFPRAIVEAAMAPAEQSGPVLRYAGTSAFNLSTPDRRRLDMRDWIDSTLAPALAALDPTRRHTIGQDFARSGDLTAIVVLEIGASLRRTWRMLIEMHNVPFDQQEQVLAWIEGYEQIGGRWVATGRGVPRLGAEYLDARGNGQMLAEHAVDRRGSQVTPVMIAESTYRDRMPRYKAGIEDRTTVLIRSDDVLQDHRAVQLVRGIPRLPDAKTDQKGERHGDSVVAGMLADWAADDEQGPVIIRTAGRRAGTLTQGYPV